MVVSVLSRVPAPCSAISIVLEGAQTPQCKAVCFVYAPQATMFALSALLRGILNRTVFTMVYTVAHCRLRDLVPVLSVRRFRLRGSGLLFPRRRFACGKQRVPTSQSMPAIPARLEICWILFSSNYRLLPHPLCFLYRFSACPLINTTINTGRNTLLPLPLQEYGKSFRMLHKANSKLSC